MSGSRRTGRPSTAHRSPLTARHQHGAPQWTSTSTRPRSCSPASASPIPRGGVAYSPEQAVYRASEIGGARWAVKAQIHSGARGKAGGIKLCGSEDEVRAGGQGAARQAAGDPPDRPRGPGGAPALRRGRRADRARALSRPGARPEERADHGRRLAAGRHGDRGDRPARRPTRSCARWWSRRSA